MSATATQYAYKVRDAAGKFVEGKLEADSEAAVADKLRAMGYVPLEVQGRERRHEARDQHPAARSGSSSRTSRSSRGSSRR